LHALSGVKRSITRKFGGINCVETTVHTEALRYGRIKGCCWNRYHGYKCWVYPSRHWHYILGGSGGGQI